MTKLELKTLWGKTGNYLHKENLRKMVRQKETKPLRVDDIIKWTQKFMNLIQNHRMTRIGNNFHFLVHINYTVYTPESVTFNINVAIAGESPKP